MKKKKSSPRDELRKQRREARENRRKARKRVVRKVATATFWLLALTVVLATVYIIYSVLNPAAPAKSGNRLAANPYAPTDFLEVDGTVICTAGPTRLGIDVSEHQGAIDWEAVREAGVDFAFVRIGYRGYSVGTIKPDDHARENLAGAKAAGLQVGVYFYAQAISTEEAAEEAAWCLDFLSGESLDLPLVYDWEWVGTAARTGSMDRETLTECVRVFCETVQTAGYQPMVYFNNHVSRDLLNLEALAKYPFWLAQFKSQMDYPYQVDFWQFSETGAIPGIEGAVDLNLMFLYETPETK